jgi:hypothetical protein
VSPQNNDGETPWLGLWDDQTPRTRNTDPVTSHKAEAKVRASGARASQGNAVLGLVRQWGPATSTQLSQVPHPALSSDPVARRYQISRRLGELADHKPPLIERVDTGKRELCWRVVAPAENSPPKRMDTMETKCYEHPSFTKAKTLPEPWRSHFAKNSDESRNWKPHITRTALASRVLVVATTRIECAWSAYCDGVEGMDHDKEFYPVIKQGSKLSEHIARAIFPQFKSVPYAK